MEKGKDFVIQQLHMKYAHMCEMGKCILKVIFITVCTTFVVYYFMSYEIYDIEMPVINR